MDIVTLLNKVFGKQYFNILSYYIYSGNGLHCLNIQLMYNNKSIQQSELTSTFEISKETKKKFEDNFDLEIMKNILLSKETDNKIIDEFGCVFNTFADIKEEILQLKN